MLSSLVDCVLELQLLNNPINKLENYEMSFLKSIVPAYRASSELSSDSVNDDSNESFSLDSSTESIKY